MKKVLALTIGLGIVFGATSFAQDKMGKMDDTTKSTKKAKKAKKTKSTAKM